MKPQHLALLALINIVWGANNIAVKEAVEALPPITAAALRFALVALLCLPWLRWLPGGMRPVLLVGVLQGALHFGCLNLAYATADNVAALALANQVGTPITLLFAVAFLGERIRLVRGLAIAAALCGIAIIGFDPAIAHEGAGVALVTLASVFYAASTVVLRGLTGVNPLTVYAWLGVVACGALTAASLAMEPGALAAAPAAPRSGWLAIAYSALGSSLLGHAGVNWLFGKYPVSTVLPLLVPAPVIGAAFAAWWFGNPITPRLALGGAIVTAAVAVIALRSRRVAAPATAVV